MYGDPPFSAALAMLLEVSAWKGAGTVSRLRDLPDKKLQDFMHSSMVLFKLFENVCQSKTASYLSLLDILRRVHNAIGKSLVAGEVFLLYCNVIPACRSSRVRDVDSNAEEATALAMTRGLKDYLSFVYEMRPSYFGRFGHSLFVRFERSQGLTFAESVIIARNIPFDPVITEAATAFPVARSASRLLLRKLGCNRLPDSEEVDELFSVVCSRYTDYLAYRRLGLEEAYALRERCRRGEEVKQSLGSIADVVTTALYYYVNECIERGGIGARILGQRELPRRG